MWDLPGPGLKPVSPALVGGFLTTAPPGKYFQLCFGHELFQAVWPQAHHLTSLSLVLLIVRSPHVAGQGRGGRWWVAGASELSLYPLGSSQAHAPPWLPTAASPALHLGSGAVQKGQEGDTLQSSPLLMADKCPWIRAWLHCLQKRQLGGTFCTRSWQTTSL